jgi:hypothetical protein
MAEVSTKPKTGTVFVLELNEAEAQYVHSALSLVEATRDQFGDSEDPVYNALGDALRAADVEKDWDAAKVSN